MKIRLTMTVAVAFCFALVIFGISAVPAHGQTITDPGFIIHGSPCVDVYCIDETYIGPTTCFQLVLSCPNPAYPPTLPANYPATGSFFLFGLATPITGVPTSRSTKWHFQLRGRGSSRYCGGHFYVVFGV